MRRKTKREPARTADHAVVRRGMLLYDCHGNTFRVEAVNIIGWGWCEVATISNLRALIHGGKK